MVLRADIKKFFFNPSKIIDAMDKKTRAGLSKAGAFIRRSAKSLIRPRKTASKPGSPPSSHTGLLRNFIYFGYDPDRRSVVVGPMKLNSGTDAPSTLEHGSKRHVSEHENKAFALRIARLRRQGRDLGGRFAKKSHLASGNTKISTTWEYKARPYMGPALKKNVSKLPEFMGPAAGGNFNAQ